MTKEKENPDHDPYIAALLAVTLVGQVLDEASVIANAAKDSGQDMSQPWHYVSSLKKLHSSRLNELYDDDMTFMSVSNGDSQYLNDNIGNLSVAVVTSTPQKAPVHAIKSRNESVIIGQGDEEFEESNTELRKSTSMIINHLFDMSNVIEHVHICNQTEVVPINRGSDRNEFLINDMTKIMDSYVDNALNIVFGQESQEDNSQEIYYETSVSDKSSYSFLSDYPDIPKDVFFNVTDEVVGEETGNEELAEIENKKKKINTEVAFYENAYLTLNRDYEQYSEDDEPVLQDPKAIPLQEVELLTANTSSEDIEPSQVKKELASSGMPTSEAGSRKSSLVRRCRIQGARMLSCLRRWWWRRKLPGRRKVPCAPGSLRGLCPLSPDARRRAASLLDQRHLRTPSPSTSMVWKFNTVNEALTRAPPESVKTVQRKVLKPHFLSERLPVKTGREPPNTTQNGASFAFSIYDFDGSGKVDAFNLGDILRALNSNPTLATIEKLGGTKKKGEKKLSLEEFLPIYSQCKKDKDQGGYEDFLECLKLYDKAENGLMLGAELTHTLLALGEKLDDKEVEEIVKDCMDPEDEDGMIPYASFLKKMVAGWQGPQKVAAAAPAAEAAPAEG
ncbi:uncharacterized protein LOC123868926 [Maniola jurtina]|uniref:uncharacterized protein LOC123868926 n=1 Tax=Maniola jurtina TaxID=191418 RepID=UPI001E689A5A|nr:uncharacterized protein LOC123868926 [Maniola jurtina]